MQDNISIIVAVIIAVIIIVIFPMYNLSTRQDSMSKNIIIKSTTTFVDEVRNKGYLDLDTYNSFVDNVAKTGNVYEIELECYNKLIVANKEAEYKDDYEVTYTKDILKILNSNLKISEEDAEISEVIQKLNDSNANKINGIYPLKEGDKFYVRIKNTNMTQAQLMLQNLFGGHKDSNIIVNYGGTVYNNEWSKSKLSNPISTNVTLSRPQNSDGIEYTKKPIAIASAGIDEDISETEYTYGIAVPINTNMDVIQFDLIYSKDVNVNMLCDASGNVLSASNYITLNGFNANTINIKKLSDSNYKVIISGITLNTGEQSKCNIVVKNGTGTVTKTGQVVGSISSVDFIIYKNLEKFDIAILAEQTGNNVKTTGVAKTTGNSTLPIKFTVNLPTGKEIDYCIWQISNLSGKPEDITVSSGKTITWIEGEDNSNEVSLFKTNTNQITAKFTKETATANTAKGCWVKVFAVATDGSYSEMEGVAFVTNEDYMKKTITGYNANISTIRIEGTKVKGGVFNLIVSSGHGTGGNVNTGDRYRIIGVTEEGKKIILVDRDILQSGNVSNINIGKPSGSTNNNIKAWYSTSIGNMCILKSGDNLYIDTNGNFNWDEDEYGVAADIQSISAPYYQNFGFKTSALGYGSTDPAEDYSLYYWVYNSLDNLKFQLKESAYGKYTNFLYDYKIMAGHHGCLCGASQISALVDYTF